MSAACLVAQLAAVGTPPELLAAVAQELFTAETERRILAERRHNERERKARSRDGTGQGVTDGDRLGRGSLDKKTQTQKINLLPHEVNTLPAREPVEILAECVDAIVTAHLKRWRGQPPPHGVTDEQWLGFLDHRKAHPKGGKFTDRAYTLLCNKLTGLAEHGFPPGQMIDLAIERGWITVFEPHDQTGPRNGRSGNGMGRHQPSDGLSPTTRAALRVFGAPPAGDERRVPQ